MARHRRNARVVSTRVVASTNELMTPKKKQQLTQQQIWRQYVPLWQLQRHNNWRTGSILMTAILTAISAALLLLLVVLWPHYRPPSSAAQPLPHLDLQAHPPLSSPKQQKIQKHQIKKDSISSSSPPGTRQRGKGGERGGGGQRNDNSPKSGSGGGSNSAHKKLKRYSDPATVLRLQQRLSSMLPNNDGDGAGEKAVQLVQDALADVKRDGLVPHPALLELLCSAHFGVGDLAAAVTCSQDVANTAPQGTPLEGRAQYNLGVILQAANRLDEALHAYHRSLVGYNIDVSRSRSLRSQLPMKLEESHMHFEQQLQDHQKNLVPVLCNAGIVAARLGKVAMAKEYIEAALRLHPGDVASQSARISLQHLEAENAERKNLQDTAATTNTGTPLTADGDQGSTLLLQTSHVRRETAANLSMRSFYQRYALPGIPVVIEGTLSVGALERWSFSQIGSACAGVPVGDALRERRAGVWAGLAPVPASNTKASTSSSSSSSPSLMDATTSVDTFFKRLQQHQHQSGRSWPTQYLFDFNLQAHCPSLLQDWNMPAYFSQDFLQRVPPAMINAYGSSSYRNYWPSLFAGAPGTRSELHIDAWCSNFWMTQLRGRKQWILFPRNQTARLYRDTFTGAPGINSSAFLFSTEAEGINSTNSTSTCSITSNCDATIDAAELKSSQHTTSTTSSLRLRSWARARFPLAVGLTPLVTTLKPGDLLFVPAGTPHWVENVGTSPTLALSGNYVDASNFACARDALRQWGVKQPAARALADALAFAGFNSTMNLNRNHPISFAEFKNAWHASTSPHH